MKLNTAEICVFGMLGAIIYVSKVAMEFLPNVHLIAVFIVTMTVAFRQKALYPLYVFIFLLGFLNGFSVWWIPYLYIWAILWLAVMLVPEKWPAKIRYPVYQVLCSLHGFLFGTLYAPAQALLFHYSLKATIAWIISGLPYDAIHGVSNFICGAILIYPLTRTFIWIRNQISGK